MGNPFLITTNAATPSRLSDSATTDKKRLTLPSKKGEVHPLHPKRKLLVVLLSGWQSAIENFHKKLRKLSQTQGEHPQDQYMSLYSNDENFIHYRGMRIPILLV